MATLSYIVSWGQPDTARLKLKTSAQKLKIDKKVTDTQNL